MRTFFITNSTHLGSEKQTPRNSEREENAHYYVHHYTHACLLRLFWGEHRWRSTGEACADYCIVMFSDLTRKVTMQNLYHDGGFSSMGMSLRAMATYQKGLEEYMDENGNIIYG